METKKITRASRHALKFCTKKKYDILDTLFSDFKCDLDFYIELILQNKLKLSKFVSSRELPSNKFTHSRWKTLVYKHASEIVRLQIKQSSERRFNQYKKVYAKLKSKNKCKWFLNKKFNDVHLKPILESVYFTVPKIEKLSINIDERFINYKTVSTMFNEFIHIRLPYIEKGYKNQGQILNLPIKYHRYSNRFKDYTKKKTIRLIKIKEQYYISFIYEKEIIDKPLQISKEAALGIDIGYKKLITVSNNTFYGTDFEKICTKLTNKKRNSKNYKQALIYKTNEINRICNQLLNTECANIKVLVVEDLKNVKKDTKKNKKLSTKFSNKLQYWSYRQVLDKLERFSEENGIHLIKVNPAYTSQTCSSCGIRDKQSRQGEVYRCSKCNLVIDADYNASINILHRGVYSLSTTKN